MKYLIIFIVILTLESVAQRKGTSTGFFRIKPPTSEGKSASVFTQPGYNFKTCTLPECEVFDWLPRDSITETFGKIRAGGQDYYMVETVTDEGLQIGFIQASYTVPAQKPCYEATLIPLPPLAIAPLEELFKGKLELADELRPMSDSEKFNNLCKRFINENGELGDLGKKMSEAIPKIGPSCFMEEIDVKSVCPKFADFSYERKIQFWAYVMASKAVIESSCNPKKHAQGPNDRAVGLFQLEKSRLKRREQKRDATWCKTSNNVNPFEINFQIECTLSILRDWSCGPTKRPLTALDGYWQELRGSRRKISALIKQFPGCRR